MRGAGASGEEAAKSMMYLGEGGEQSQASGEDNRTQAGGAHRHRIGGGDDSSSYHRKPEEGKTRTSGEDIQQRGANHGKEHANGKHNNARVHAGGNPGTQDGTLEGAEGVLECWEWVESASDASSASAQNDQHAGRGRRAPCGGAPDVPGLVIFLHLLGLDTNGHAHRPMSRQYADNVRLVDDIIRRVYALVEARYGHDGRTAYIFTSDHGMSNKGSHGDGDPVNTECPLVAWGAGIKVPGRPRGRRAYADDDEAADDGIRAAGQPNGHRRPFEDEAVADAGMTVGFHEYGTSRGPVHGHVHRNIGDYGPDGGDGPDGDDGGPNNDYGRIHGDDEEDGGLFDEYGPDDEYSGGDHAAHGYATAHNPPARSFVDRCQQKGATTPASWAVSHATRRDVDQADIAPLMATLLGVPIPVNSVGRTPLEYLDVGAEGRARALYLNARQLLSQVLAKSAEVQAHSLPLFWRPYPPLRHHGKQLRRLEDLLASRRWSHAQAQAERLREMCVASLAYFQTYDWLFLVSAVVLGYLGWIALLMLKVSLVGPVGLMDLPLALQGGHRDEGEDLPSQGGRNYQPQGAKGQMPAAAAMAVVQPRGSWGCGAKGVFGGAGSLRPHGRGAASGARTRGQRWWTKGTWWATIAWEMMASRFSWPRALGVCVALALAVTLALERKPAQYGLRWLDRPHGALLMPSVAQDFCSPSTKSSQWHA
eukprot:jgi/Mesvir1/23724/Mv18668-RA.2